MRSLGFVALLLLANQAHAYEIGSSVTADCHERLTLAAIEGLETPSSFGPAVVEDAARVAELLPARIPTQRRDPFTVAAVAGVRNVDLGARSPSRFPGLAAFHADPSRQPSHCLRGPDHDGAETADAAALAACRRFILEELTLALGETGVQGTATEVVEIWLPHSDDGRRVELSRFGFHLGRALHAMQDAFTHHIRTADGLRVRHVLNYVDGIESSHDPARDGRAHRGALDDCTLDDPIVVARFAQAAEASRDLATAALTDGPRAERLAAAELALDRWLATADDDCGHGDDYCEAPELSVRAAGCAVSAPGALGASVAGWIVALSILTLVWRRRGVAARTLGLTALLAFGAAGTARADDDVATEETTADEAPPLPTPPPTEGETRVEEAGGPALAAEAEAADTETPAEVVAVHPEEEEVTIRETRRVEPEDLSAAHNDGLGVVVRAFGGVDQVVFGGGIGLHWPITEWLVLGFDAEYDGWYSIEAANTSNGIVAAYLSATVIWTTIDRVEIRSALHAGASVLLFDYPGIDAGSVGPFVGVTPLALGIRLDRAVRLLLEPGGVFFAVPGVEGIPLAHRHHRFAVGLVVTP